MQKINITNLDKEGTFRSLNGAASENIFIGKASAAGFFCFFKAWRDMPYDAIVDYKGILYRVEVKGSANSVFDISRGGRSGRQISRDAESRKRPIERSDCDFVVCVDANNNDCYIVPVDFIEIVGGETFSKTCISQFKEKWELFLHSETRLTGEQTRDGLQSLDLPVLQEIAERLGAVIPTGQMKIKGVRRSNSRSGIITDEKSKVILAIWEKLCSL